MFIKLLSHTHSHFPPFSLNPSTKSWFFFLHWDGNYHAVKWEDGKQKHSARLWLPASQAPYTARHTAPRHCRPERGCMYLWLPELRKIRPGSEVFQYTWLGMWTVWQRCPCGALNEATPGLWGCASWDDDKAQRNGTDPVPDDTDLYLSSLKLKLSACFRACSSGMPLPTWHATRAVHWRRQRAISAGFMTAMIQVGEGITQPPGMRRTPGRSLAHDSVIIHVHTISLLSHMACRADLALCSPTVGNIW